MISIAVANIVNHFFFKSENGIAHSVVAGKTTEDVIHIEDYLVFFIIQEKVTAKFNHAVILWLVPKRSYNAKNVFVYAWFLL